MMLPHGQRRRYKHYVNNKYNEYSVELSITWNSSQFSCFDITTKLSINKFEQSVTLPKHISHNKFVIVQTTKAR